jgi:hypothetical protein
MGLVIDMITFIYLVRTLLLSGKLPLSFEVADAMMEVLTSVRSVSYSHENLILLFLSFSPSLFLSLRYFLLLSFSTILFLSSPLLSSLFLNLLPSLFLLFSSSPSALLSLSLRESSYVMSYCPILFCSFLSSRKAITSTYIPRSDAILPKFSTIILLPANYLNLTVTVL